MARARLVSYLDTVQDGLSPATSHPDYVAVAPEWLWDESDPRAPFGSDDGHDTLRTLEEHFVQGGGDEHVPGCIASLIADWALVPETIWDSSTDGIAAAPEPPMKMQLRMAGGNLAGVHWRIDGTRMSSSEKARILTALDVAEGDVFPFDWNYAVPFTRDTDHDDTGIRDGLS